MLLLFFIYGIAIGSFLNVCIYRLPLGQSVISPPSHCPSCNARIKAYDLIPIVSFIILGGRCRSCGTKISFKYPCIELLNGLLFSICYMYFGANFKGVICCIAVSILTVVLFIRIERYLLKSGK